MTNPFSLVTFASEEGRPQAGLVVRETVYPAGGAISTVLDVSADRYGSVLAILEEWPSAIDALAAAAAKLDSDCRREALPGVPLEEARLFAPVLYPSAIYGSGANYTDHMEEMAAVLNATIENPKAQGQLPWHFVKTPRSVLVGHGAVIQIPAYSTMVDWEIELAAVIGKITRNVSVEDAIGCVAAYTIANDLSARDHVRRNNVKPDSPFAYDWVSQKCFDGSCPMGPFLVPACLVKDPLNLSLRLWINGVLKQDSSTSRMIFNVAEQVAYLSSRTTLYPGDVVLTGTPAGVGMARQEFLKSGDVMTLEIEGLGRLANVIA
ncbi:fumarylacetoacetate hydrolase family protein [Trinickia sp. YCB016]